MSRGTYIGNYTYLKELKNGKWTIYRGCWSNNGENNTTGLSVERDFMDLPLRFNSFDEAFEYAKEKWGCRNARN